MFIECLQGDGRDGKKRRKDYYESDEASTSSGRSQNSDTEESSQSGSESDSGSRSETSTEEEQFVKR